MDLVWVSLAEPGVSDSRAPVVNDLPAANHLVWLVEEARAGSRQALERLIGLFREPIFRMVYCRTYSRMDAEDLTQEIFLQAFQHLPQLKDPARFRAWLFSIAVNRVRDFHRKRRFLSFLGLSPEEDCSEQLESEIDSAPGALDTLLRREFWEQVRTFADKLSRWEREVFFLRFIDQLSIAEIAQVVNKNESSVKTHLYRALRKFKDASALLQSL